MATYPDLNVEYRSKFYDAVLSDQIIKELLDYEFYSLPMYGTHKICAFADTEAPSYPLSGGAANVHGVPWTSTMLRIKADVEKATGVQFNFALLNYYGAAAAQILDPPESSGEAPIVGLSFGAERALQLKRPGYPTQEIHLHHGSLYVLQAPTHGILVDPTGISITFRHLGPSTKRRKLESTLLYYKEFGLFGPILQVVEREGGALRVEMCPTHSGASYDYEVVISMSPSTWYEFSRKFEDFRCRYVHTSFVCGNELIVVNNKQGGCVLQHLQSSVPGFYLKRQCLELDSEEEVEFLQGILSEVSDVLLKNIFTTSLPKLIKRHYKALSGGRRKPTQENEAKFYNCLYQALVKCVNETFTCEGCKVSHPSQLRHDCINKFVWEKLTDNDMFLNVNLLNLCMDVCKHVQIEHLEEGFFSHVTVEKCVEVLKRDRSIYE